MSCNDKQIFISFSALDAEQVSNIYNKLQELGFTVTGTFFGGTELIESHNDPAPFEKADVSVAIITPNYIVSNYAMAELSNLLLTNNSDGRVLLYVIGDILLPSFAVNRSLINRVDSIDSILPLLINSIHEIEKTASEQQNAPKSTGLNDKQFLHYSEHDSNDNVTMESLRKALTDSHLTLVCGAGISIPSGIPTWTELLADMLERRFSLAQSEGPEKSRDYVRELVGTMPQSSIILGKYLKILYNKDFEESVKTCLYSHIATESEGLQQSAISTSMMNAIVSLARPKRNRNPLDSIITFNFDDLIERAFQTANIDYCSIWDEGQTFDVHELPIYHVHGYLPFNSYNEKSNLVFSEDSYHSQFIDPYSWSNLLQLNTFSNNVCLFVGLSLSDPNLRRLLDISWRRNQRRKHYIIMKRTAGAKTEKQGAGTEITDIVDMLFEQDANSLGLNVIWCSDYSEIPTILVRVTQT